MKFKSLERTPSLPQEIVASLTGALHAGDSLGPLLFVGCGPESADERPQWALRDVAPVVLSHFGL